ncbi:MAG TPA: glycoside hydrolase family 43 protein [Tepidisphaeraceae bacterium]|nr:glycoside hydrolase family 43 protein [Tepidisphaeraceae bacterium]
MNRTFPAMMAAWVAVLFAGIARADNPLIRGIYTADPAALVYNGRVYLYTGHDEAPSNNKRFVMRDWRCFSSDDMINWTDHGSPLSLRAFPWARANAWAGQVIERSGKFYWYVPMSHRTVNGFAIGVAVSDSPTGPFVDAIGKALITNDMTPAPFDPKIGRVMDWDDIDPTIFIDDDGQAFLFWGNTVCHFVKLKSNMIEMDGPIVTLEVPKFTEAPWVHKYKGLYYLSYAYDFPEKIAYMTAAKVTGPWTWRGVINDVIPNSGTNHQAIIEFKGKSYFFYHNVELSNGDEWRRSVCVEELFYNPDGSIKPITQSRDGIGAKPVIATTQPG